MRVTTPSCPQSTKTIFKNLRKSISIYLMLFLLGSFFVNNLSAQCPAGVCPSPGTIQVDGNPCDWSTANFATFATKSYQLDKFGNGVKDSQFTEGSKDFFEAEDLIWSFSQTKAKNDIANGAAVLVGTNLYFAGDRTSNNGAAQIGFWFYLNGTAPQTAGDGTQNFAPNHAIGDLLVLADFSAGGREATVSIYRWVGTGGNVVGSNGTLNTTNCQGIVAQNNDVSYPPPAGWTFINPCYDYNEFYEGRVDLSCVLEPGSSLCFSSFLLETRSSHEISASLDDFVSGAFAAKPLAPTVTPASRCGSGSITLSATCTASTLRWYTASSGGSPLVTGGIYTVSGNNLTINPLAATTTYYAACYNAALNCESDRTPVVATINANPTANAGPDEAKCQTAPSGPTSFTLAGTATNGTTAWSQIGSTGTASASITTPGSLTSAVSVSGIGTVTLRLTTTSNATPSCGTATDDVILTVNANPTANAGPDETKCQTAPSGPTSFTLAGTAANGTTAWTQIGSTGTASASITTPGSLTSAVSVSGIGTVTLRLTTTSNATPSCGTATDDVILTVNANPTANAGPDEAKCQTAPSGPTSFTLAGTAANGTTAWSQIGSTGTASASITTPGSLTSAVSVSGIGTVTLRLTTTSNTTPACGSATDDVILTVNANPTANAGPDEAKCQTAPSGPTSFTLAGTAANGTTAWTQIGSTGTASASITTPGSLTSAVSVSGIGTVTLRLTTTSNATPSCGTATDDVILTVNANPTANAGPDQTKCQTPPSGPTSFTLAGTAANGTTAWTQIGSTGTASASITTPGSLTSTVSVSGIGTVTLRLTTTSNATPSCGTATDDVVLAVNTNPTANAGPDQTKCQVFPAGPTPFTLAGSATNGTTLWSQIASTGTANASITTPSSLTSGVSVSGAGTVTLRLTTTSNATPSCGTATDDVILTVNALPLIRTLVPANFCPSDPFVGGSLTLQNAQAGVSYQLQLDNVNTQAPKVAANEGDNLTWTGLAAGNYTVEATVIATSCNTESGPATVNENTSPVAGAGPDQAKCQTAPSGPTSFTLAGTASNGTPLWSQVGSTGTASASITTPASLTSAVSVSGIGTVTLRLTVTSNATPPCGSSTDDVVLTVNANPTANAGPDQTKCQTAPSGPTSFTLAGTAANGTTAWTQIGSTGTASASITTPGSLTSAVSVSGIGTVTLRLTTTSNATPSCGTATDDVILTVNANPTANAGPDQTKCQTAPSGPTSFTLAGTAANGTTAWTQIGSTGTASASITTPSSLTSNVNVSGIGTVTLRLTTTSNATPSCGTATDDVILTVNANPTANAGPDQAKCQTKPSGPTSFTLAGTAANGTTAWSQVGSTGTASASITTPGSLTSAVSVSGVGTVTLRLTTTSNASPSCGTATDDVILTVNANPTCSIEGDNVICKGDATTFTASGGAAGATYSWTGPAGFTPTVGATITNVTIAGTYTVVITNLTECTNTCNITLELENCNPEFNCTYTQGAYGSVNGEQCDGVNSYANTTDILTVLLGINPGPANPLTIGRPGFSLTVPATVAGRDDFIEYMPAGSSAKALNAGNCDITTACVDQYLKNDNFNNVLIGQTFTLALNTRLNSGQLLDLELENGYLVTQQRDGCGENATTVSCADNAGAIKSFKMNEAVVNYLKSIGGGTATVEDLLNLANDVLGHAKTPGVAGVPSFSDVNDAVDKINNAFDECRTFVGYYYCAATCANIGSGANNPPVTSVSAGPDQTITAGQTVTLAGTIVNPGTTVGRWTTSGTGTFNPGGAIGTAGNAVYTPGAADITAGTVTLTWSADPEGPCPAKTDQMVITINPVVITFARTSASAEAGVVPTDLQVAAFPNPFTDKVNFVIASPVSGQAVLEVHNLLGQRVQTIYKGFLFAGRNQVIEYKAPATANNTLIYTLRVGDQKITGKLLRIK